MNKMIEFLKNLFTPKAKRVTMIKMYENVDNLNEKVKNLENVIYILNTRISTLLKESAKNADAIVAMHTSLEEFVHFVLETDQNEFDNAEFLQRKITDDEILSSEDAELFEMPANKILKKNELN